MFFNAKLLFFLLPSPVTASPLFSSSFRASLRHSHTIPCPPSSPHTHPGSTYLPLLLFFLLFFPRPNGEITGRALSSPSFSYLADDVSPGREGWGGVGGVTWKFLHFVTRMCKNDDFVIMLSNNVAALLAALAGDVDAVGDQLHLSSFLQPRLHGSA